MKNKEVLIANLRKQIEELEKIPKSIHSTRRKLEGLIAEIEDESKIGTPPEFDFGSQVYKKVLASVLKELKKNIKILKETGDFIASLQKETTTSVPSQKEFEG